MDKILGISQGIQHLDKKKVSSPDGDQFKKSLNEALEKKDAQNVQKTTSQSLGEIQAPLINPVQTSPKNIVEITTELLDRLDAYANELKDPTKSLKQIEPLITSIKDEAVRLAEDADNENNSDTGIKNIAKEFAVTAQVEYFKFQRGDYI